MPVASRRPAANRAFALLAVSVLAFPTGRTALARVDAPVETPRQFGRDRLVDILHLRLELTVQPREQRIAGNAQLTVLGLADGTLRAELDAVDFEDVHVSVDGHPAVHDYDARTLGITFDPPLGDGERRTIRVDYVAHPANGLHWVKPDARRPGVGWEAWSQGEDENNRYWFPVHDSTNERLTSETLITVLKPLQCVSNGRLAAVTDAPGNAQTWHHVMDFPHVPYLVSIAVGDWATERSEWEGVELSTHVPRPFAGDAERSFANTARILAFLSAETGVKYPYAAYRQTCVTDYMHGGMENIAATTLTPDTLHDARAHVDYPSESLVAHEVAHQWFGDYVTCSDWSDTWLNEGFATYYAALSMGEIFGPDQFVEELDRIHDSAIKADAGDKRRPVVADTFKNPNEMFDGHSYAKGASVLQALRRELGEAAYRKAIRAWLETQAGQSANTHALIAAVEASTGREVSRFFDQWLYRAGQPELEVAWKWHGGAVQLTVVQAQERGPLVGLFDLPLDVQVLGDDFTLDREVRVSAERETFHLDVPQRPRAVVVDPQGWLLRTVKLDRETGETRFVLAQAPHLLSRLEAARELASELAEPGVIAALAERLAAGGESWVLRREVARSLGKARSDAGRLALVAALASDADSRVRTAAAEALGEHEAAGVAAALRQALSSDDSYAVRAAAARALGKARVPGAERLLERALAQPSHRGEVARAALEALEEMKASRALALAERECAWGRPMRLRAAAVAVRARLAADAEDKAVRKEVREALVRLLDDPHDRVQRSAAEGLGVLGDPEALPILRQLAASAYQSALRRTATDAIAAIETSVAKAARVADLSRQLSTEKEAREELARQLQALESRLADLEADEADEADESDESDED